MWNVNWTHYWSVMVVYVWVAGIGLAALLAYLVVYLMAKRDFIVGFVPEGQIKAVMAGDSLHKLLVNIRGYRYDRSITKTKKFPEIVLDPKKGGDKLPWWKQRPFGLYWIGLPPFKQILTYKFSWVKWGKPKSEEGEKEKKEEFGLIPRDEEVVRSLFFRYPYGVEVKGIKVKGNVEVNITLVVTLEAVRPETTLFRIQPTGNWLGLAIAKITEATRGWAGEKEVDIETLRGLAAREKGATNDFRTRIMEMNGEKGRVQTGSKVATKKPIFGQVPELPDGILRLCGVRIISVEFQNWKFTEPTMLETFQSEEVEFRKARGIAAKAEGEAVKIRKTGEAEAAIIKKKLDATGQNAELAVRLAEAEALRLTQVRVLSLGGKAPVHTIPVDGPTAALD